MSEVLKNTIQRMSKDLRQKKETLAKIKKRISAQKNSSIQQKMADDRAIYVQVTAIYHAKQNLYRLKLQVKAEKARK